HARHSLFARGAVVLTKSRVYNKLRSIDAKIARTEAKILQTSKKARTAGKREIRDVQREGRRIVREGLATQKVIDEYEPLVAQKDLFAQQASDLGRQIEMLMRGELDTKTLSQLGVELPEGSTLRGLGGGVLAGGLAQSGQGESAQH